MLHSDLITMPLSVPNVTTVVFIASVKWLTSKVSFEFKSMKNSGRPMNR